MNLRRIWAFFRTPVGRLVLFLGLFFVLISGGVLRKKPQTVLEKAERGSVTHATHSRFIHHIPAPPSRVRVSESKSQVPAQESAIQSQWWREDSSAPQRSSAPPPIPMAIYDASESVVSPEHAQNYLPFGRLVRCELINTVDTSNILTPIIGLVTDDVWQEGNIIIPAGTEVHGVAAPQPERERVGTGARWMLIFPDGRELAVSGIALDHAPIPHQEMWEISDGSAGLRGSLIQSDRYTEIKAVSAAMLAAAADGFIDKTEYISHIGGTSIRRSSGWRTAIAAGLERGAQLISQRLLERGDPFFVRVPAGTTFYLYTTQSINLQQAKIAGSRLPETSPSQSEAPQQPHPEES